MLWSRNRSELPSFRPGAQVSRREVIGEGRGDLTLGCREPDQRKGQQHRQVKKMVGSMVHGVLLIGGWYPSVLTPPAIASSVPGEGRPLSRGSPPAARGCGKRPDSSDSPDTVAAGASSLTTILADELSIYGMNGGKFRPGPPARLAAGRGGENRRGPLPATPFSACWLLPLDPAVSRAGIHARCRCPTGRPAHNGPPAPDCG